MAKSVLSLLTKGSTTYILRDLYMSATASASNMTTSSDSSTKSITIYPGYYYNFGVLACNNLNVTLSGYNSSTLAEASTVGVKEYNFQYEVSSGLVSSGTSTMKLTITPGASKDAIHWAVGNPNPGTKGYRYEISILDGMALCASVEA